MRRLVACAVLVTSWTMLLLHDQGVFENWPRGDVSNAAMLIAVAIAFVVGAYVDHWAVVGLAATPLVVLGLLQATGYTEPFHEPQPPLYGWWAWVALCAAPLAFGVVLRSIADSARSSRSLTPK